MKIHDYCTSNGKNLIKEYLHTLPKPLQAEGYAIRHKIISEGLDAFSYLNTRQLIGKLWEIKFGTERIMYMIADSENTYFLHICKKQKGKSEKFELETAISRAQQANLWK